MNRYPNTDILILELDNISFKIQLKELEIQALKNKILLRALLDIGNLFATVLAISVALPNLIVASLFLLAFAVLKIYTYKALGTPSQNFQERRDAKIELQSLKEFEREIQQELKIARQKEKETKEKLADTLSITSQIKEEASLFKENKSKIAFEQYHQVLEENKNSPNLDITPNLALKLTRKKSH